MIPFPKLRDKNPPSSSLPPPIYNWTSQLHRHLSLSSFHPKLTQQHHHTNSQHQLLKSYAKTVLHVTAMGLCMSSCGAAAAVRSEGLTASTAMVLLPTGELRDYPQHSTAARALDDAVEGDAGWFLCDADAMGFEGAVSAMGAGEELRPGQIYFVLPSEARHKGLRREDVAALAVRASAALVDKANTAPSGTGGRRRRARSVSPLVFAPPVEVDENVAYKTVPAVVAKRHQVARVKSAGRMQPRFAPDLTAIPEYDMIE